MRDVLVLVCFMAALVAVVWINKTQSAVCKCEPCLCK